MFWSHVLLMIKGLVSLQNHLPSILICHRLSGSVLNKKLTFKDLVLTSCKNTQTYLGIQSYLVGIFPTPLNPLLICLLCLWVTS